MTQLMRRLQDARQIERRRSRSDARAYEISLTELGQITLELGLRAARLSEEQLMTVLGDRANQLRELLALINTLPEHPRGAGLTGTRPARQRNTTPDVQDVEAATSPPTACRSRRLG